MILGLDCSTTVCGYAFYDGNNIVDAGFIDISKQEKNSEKAFFIIRTLESNPSLPLLKEIRLEAALSGFQRGRTSQQVVILLARFNAVLEYILATEWAVPVTLIGAMTARKKVLGKAFIKGMTAKEYVRQELPKHVPNIAQFEKLNRDGNWNKKNEDMYDAIVIAKS